MKVLHLLSTNRFSGAENVVCQIIHMFREEDFDMAYCSPDGEIRKSLSDRGVKYMPLEKLSVKNVRKIVKSFKPDIIHAHDIRASIIASCFSRKCKIISHVHVNGSGMNCISLKSLLYFLRTGHFSHTFWVSNSSFDSYYFKKKLPEFKNSVLYNIIDTNITKSKMSNDTLTYNYDISFVGRLAYQKNPQRLIKVMKKCIEQNPNIKCAIIGTGDLSDEIATLINSENLSDNIKLLGFMSNPLKIVHDSKVMIMTSRFEGTPMCALEAMTLGVPIVSTRTDGMVDLIEDGKTGFLSDDDDEIAEKICRIISDTELHDAMSRAASEKAEIMMNIEAYLSSIKNAYN